MYAMTGNLNGFMADTRALIRALGPLTQQPNLLAGMENPSFSLGGKKVSKKKSNDSYASSVIGMANWADKQGVQDGELTLDELEDVEFDMMSFANSGVSYQKARYARLKSMIKYFEKIDTDNSGSLDSKELARFFGVKLKSEFVEA